MGNYLTIPKKVPKTFLKKWFDKHGPFYNDFGDKHDFDDIFGDKNKKDGSVNFKYGVMDKKFYSKEAMRDLEDLISKIK